jgi:hypothetical protein
MLINHFSYNDIISRDERCAHRATQDVCYCLFNFDIALIILDGVHHLPSTFSFVGSPFHHPPDTGQGETTYDPFAFDVACLGNALCIFNASRAFYLVAFTAKLNPPYLTVSYTTRPASSSFA